MARMLVWLAIGLSIAASAAAADAPFTYMVVPSESAASAEVALHGTITLQLSNEGAINKDKVRLLVDGDDLGVTPRYLPDSHRLVFGLVKNTKNQTLWQRLLGSPLAHPLRSLPIALLIDDKAVQATTAGGQADQAMIALRTYDARWFGFGCFVVIAVAAVTAVLCWRTCMMRDSLLPQLRIEDRPFSLGRLQMAVWFCIIFAAFWFILIVTGDINSITSEAFILLGISGATALGSVAVDQSRNQDLVATEKQIEGMGLRTAADVAVLYKAIADGDGGAPATGAIPAAVVQGIANPTLAQLRDAYERAIASYKSDGLLRDLVNDVNGPTIHRWQILVWTVVLAGVYVVRVYGDLEMPTLGTNLLTLMGISGGVYLGFKIPERQS